MSDILITGSHGFIGSHIRKLFPTAYCIDLKIGNDICDELPNEDFKYIFHLAASRSVPVGEKQPEEFIKNNCWGTENILRSYPDARIINISSSSAEYAISVYGRTKLYSETAGKTHSNCLNVRLYNVFGEGQPLSSGAVVPTFVNCKLTGSRPKLYNYGNDLRDYTYVGDVVENLVDLMFESKQNCGLFHIGYNKNISTLELLHMIYHPDNPSYELLPSRKFDIPVSMCPIEMPIVKYGREEGIRRTLEWYKNEYNRAGRIE